MEFLVLLACPVGMGLMMWFMARGMGRDKRDFKPGSIDDLRAEQARLTMQVERLERTDAPASSQRAANTRS